MNINILLKELSKLVFFAFNKKKILFFWLFMYILGLPLIYTYKSIYYEYDYKVKFLNNICQSRQTTQEALTRYYLN